MNKGWLNKKSSSPPSQSPSLSGSSGQYSPTQYSGGYQAPITPNPIPSPSYHSGQYTPSQNHAGQHYTQNQPQYPSPSYYNSSSTSYNYSGSNPVGSRRNSLRIQPPSPSAQMSGSSSVPQTPVSNAPGSRRTSLKIQPPSPSASFSGSSSVPSTPTNSSRYVELSFPWIQINIFEGDHQQNSFPYHNQRLLLHQMERLNQVLPPLG
jgi:hypothetical protein